jgi:uncharacterized Zn-finger protein
MQHSEGEKRYSCELCIASYSQKPGLARHVIEQHKNIPSFQCTLCISKFKRKIHLDRHIREHHENIRSFECTICGLKFKRNNHLKVHMEKRHLHDKQYKCGLCELTWNDSVSLDRHNNEIHRVTYIGSTPGVSLADIRKKEHDLKLLADELIDSNNNYQQFYIYDDEDDSNSEEYGEYSEEQNDERTIKRFRQHYLTYIQEFFTSPHIELDFTKRGRLLILFVNFLDEIEKLATEMDIIL